ncbi:carbohydrate ABC transporter permease [Ruminococcus sp. AF37-6AT]|jgi:raffinose/stachyose/melibiose transport system permease protein|uniref:carbohydrate ABC transporter permease n=1 Tax=Blautia sp. HCN-1074 TaxID=3134667 RepID=UPI000E4CCF32|nr:carbohydrate ABC transporter permease [Ruminococcus sp. AF13-37]RGW22020.1 carbohydrate ABC transporter permease [Ruminococcus sp. AF13-28]RHD94187.1 carbohydrate ABC transporter permease [Ruminococcus sp. AM30-15AC]RHG56896.1 carbohydrate ABC transporter permease [Ruminococcus sp. AM22-13]RHJ99024.1 carbohydrate ABC transporter permease [Ruminococcus sp. AM07-21]RHL50774.1 carbohydrate ABC transporter permease [Ruminococcus sp. AF37-6AT]RHP58019.1 carbohydrate ABC transporter permease [Ru
MDLNQRGYVHKKAGLAIKIIVLICALVVYMFPFVMVIINSFKIKRDIIKEPMALIGSHGASLDNYVEAFHKMNFIRAFLNSLCITGVSVVLIIITSAMCAYLFVRMDYKINKIFFGLMIASMVIPFQVIMIPLVSIYGGNLHILNHRLTLILMHVGFSTAQSVFMYHGFIKSNIPMSLEEAAKLDGCTKYQTFFRIVFPLLKPTTATLVILYAMGIWNDFLLPSLVLTQKELYTLPIATQMFYGTYSSDLGLIMASLLMVAAPVIVLYLFLQKYIIAGVVAGAVKS